MNKTGQSIIEFCFAATIFLLMIYGLAQTVRWVQMDLAERRFDHDTVLTNDTVVTGEDVVVSETNPNFHRTRPMDAVLFRKP